jgi:hypothetical protein
VSDRKPFLLRIDPAILEAMQRWANDDLRSLNAQVEFVLRDALRKTGRIAQPDRSGGSGGSGEPDLPHPDS